MGLYILKKLLISGERMIEVRSGMKNGGNIMMHLESLRNGQTNGAASTQAYPLMPVMLTFGMKGTKIRI